MEGMGILSEETAGMSIKYSIDIKKWLLIIGSWMNCYLFYVY
jgi:hypothetical protein